MSGELHRYFLNNGERRLHKWVHYFDIYERYFDQFRGRAPTILEIGIFGGGSLAMWRDYFGADATILGLDIKPETEKVAGAANRVYIGSQDDPALLDRVLAENPSIDIVIDDGSHVMRHMIATFEHLYPRISPNGVYLVEDTHTCYMSKFDGGLRREGSWMEFVKDRLDDLHATYTNGELKVSAFTRSTKSISIYDSIAVFEKAPQGKRQAFITEAMS
ncbi:class I SAM-dependent methyltransferase [Jiella sp. CBK1P-4]|uniref:Class I SAM-dependent methyltransferase n=2 Tax=Jiella avicenniae TaxID=2907202 RepID=A0A9X1P1Q1_9HYPH|nr:class I SAM-dependent methyltransferase [Jiella avicenniae]MCE7028486.1 class I SAM-dependent methyltransferase [Jiella avicenniae]